MLETILIANRGEIACRIMRTCRALGIRTVAVYSDADVDAMHVQVADTAVHLGPAPATESYLAGDKIIAAAQRTGADAIHPGYGFLAENADFARAVTDAGLTFIGPSAAAIAAMGNKRAAKALVAQAGVPTVPGYSGDDQRNGRFQTEADAIGYPVMVKASAGGGGKGMRVVHAADDLSGALDAARREAQQAFGSDELLLEKALTQPRHVEIQVFGDHHGHVIHLGERECTVQRRHQKVIEETPSPALTAVLRQEMGAAAVAAARAVDYVNAGTVEFLLDTDDNFYFLEMNTRLQVEHPVTEMVTGLDLVAWQIRVAEGEPLPLAQDAVALHGHAVEARVYAENPARDFLPVTGDVLLWRAPQGDGVRVDDGIRSGDRVSIHYDPLLAKVVAHGSDRKTAVRRLIRALETAVLLGLTHNVPFLRDVLRHPDFVAGAIDTGFIAANLGDWQPPQADAVASLAVSLLRFRRQAQAAANGGYWRNNANRPQLYRYAVPGQDAPVEVQLAPLPRREWHFQVQIGGQTLHVQLNHLDGADVTLTVDGVRQRVTAVAQDDTWWIQTQAGALSIAAKPLLSAPRARAGAGGSLRAPMPGSVIAVLVDTGETVRKGQALMTLEAMKMEHTIRTDADGVVEAIYFQPGDTVDADAQLLSIRTT